jgi:plastocyanin
VSLDDNDILSGVSIREKDTGETDSITINPGDSVTIEVQNTGSWKYMTVAYTNVATGESQTTSVRTGSSSWVADSPHTFNDAGTYTIQA